MKKNKLEIFIISLFFLGITSIIAFTGFLFTDKSVGIHHLFHIAFPSGMSKEPIIQQRFNFHEKGYRAEFSFKPKLRTFYEIGLIAKQNVLLSGYGDKEKKGYKFSGKLLFQLFQENKLVEERIIETSKYSVFQKNDMNFYRDVCLYIFPLPVGNGFTKNIKIRLKVIEPDLELEKYKDDISLVIGYSWYL